MALRIVVSLGTDHHRFDRLVDWLDEWVALQYGDAHYTLQHGHSRASNLAENRMIVPREEVVDLMRAADVVITQAGPGSIFDAHEAGHRPIVVARRHAFDEVVDDHQVFFADLMEGLGDCVVARNRDTLFALLDRVRTDTTFLRRPFQEPPAEQTAAEFRRRLDAAVAHGPGWVRFGRLAQTMGWGRHPVQAAAPDPPVLPLTDAAVTVLARDPADTSTRVLTAPLTTAVGPPDGTAPALAGCPALTPFQENADVTALG